MCYINKIQIYEKVPGGGGGGGGGFYMILKVGCGGGGGGGARPKRNLFPGYIYIHV